MSTTQTIAKQRWRRGFHRLFKVAIIIPVLVLSWAGFIQADTENPEILYARSGSSQFEAVLELGGDQELFPNEKSLVTITVDGKSVPFEFSTDQRGQIKVSGSLPNLLNGRHNAIIETFAPDRQRIDGRQVLLMVDSVPPTIELVEPLGPLPRTSTSLLFAVKDNENGSGVAAEPEASSLEINITGVQLFSSEFVLKDNATHLLVTFDHYENIAQPDYKFSISVSLKDRAGNKGSFSREFITSGLVQPEFIRLCKENNTSILRALGLIVYPQKSGLKLKAGESSLLSFYLYGNYGKDYTYPAVVENDQGKNAPEYSELDDFFQKEIGRRIEIVDSPGNLVVERLKDHDFTDHRVAFNIRQGEAVALGEQVGAIQVRAPNAFYLDKTIDYCQYDDFSKIPAEHFTYTYQTITVPVVQDVTGQPVKMRVFQEDNQLVSLVKFDSVALMDTAASWFEIDGEKHWYEVQDDACIARGAVQEGTVHYRVAATHAIARFRSTESGNGEGERTVYNEGDFIVKMSPPLISGFSYDRQTNTLRATVTDEGTPADELNIKLGLPGYDLDFEFDAATGELTAPLDFTPQSVVEASLQITDGAEQTISARCKIFGNPDSPNTPVSEPVAAAYSQSGSTRTVPGTSVIGAVGKGLHLVKACSEKTLQWGFYSKGKFLAINPESARLVRLRVRDSAMGRFPTVSQPGSNRNAGIEIFYNQYDTTLYEPVSGVGASVRISMTNASTSSVTGGQKIYYATGYYENGRFIPANYNIGLSFTTQATKACQVEKRDISSPVVQATYDPGSGLVTGTIHDSGQPLSQLKISYSARSDVKNTHSYRETLPFTFKAGKFSGRFEPPKRGEFFVLEIRAADVAGNVGLATIKVMIPRSPPEVAIQVETESSQLVFSNNSRDINTYMTATAVDDSELISGATTFWLDDQVLAQFNRPDTSSYLGRSSAFTRSNSSYQGMYAAKIVEGSHTARFRATDAAGLSAETSRQFDFNLAPIIRDLKVMSGAVLKAGGPVFTALVIDRGGDLDINGLQVTINGEVIETSRLFYDSASGYFAVEGPLDLEDGRHTVQLTAVDSRGNRAEASMQFVRQLQVIQVPAPQDGTGLNIDTVFLMELRDHNGDGLANPGELVRVFVPLRNDSQFNREECRGSMFSGNEKITVEKDRVYYGKVDAGAVSVPMQGFDLQVDRDILSGISSDPYEIHFDLAVTCGSWNERRLPLALPIYRPSVPIDIHSAVSIKLDRLPSTTTSEELAVSGDVASTGARLDSVIVRVNGIAMTADFNRDGGRFEVTVQLIEGANVIEAEVIDQTGARAYASSYIHRSPAFIAPEITISSPVNNAFFQCGDLTVIGKYNPGNSTLGRLEVTTPWSGKKGCPVTIMSEDRFSANCGPVIPLGGVYKIEGLLETSDGIQARDSRNIIVGDCF